MTDLERMVRESLGAHAEEVDTTVPVAARAGAAARSRRGTRIAVGAVVAAVAAVAVVVVASGQTDAPNRTVPPASSQSPATTPAGWRTEYWNDVQVAVPADWGWGTAPIRIGDELALCGDIGEAMTGYVGRPISLSDVCLGGDVGHDPEAPYVWLGSELPLGTADVGNGYTRETVQVGGTAVTVATDDPALRQQILDSVAVGGPCAPSLDAPPGVEPAEDGALKAADSLLVCAYRDEGGGDYRLVAAEELGAEAAAATEDAIRSAPVLTGDCLNASGGEWATLTASGDGWSREYVVDLNCPAVTDSLWRMHRLTPEMVEPWAVGALPYSLYGPMGGKGAWFGHFIGVLG
ncbi:hypothetical protein [Nocardioides sp. SR21]|uniref:hypothetical protein n=1 Tax=Nocardioides sp. SR21 TaxID=2919501 RepID=UPI001FA9CE84|nr:hypothetical protein [Nocardioides sp. SR21]